MPWIKEGIATLSPLPYCYYPPSWVEMPWIKEGIATKWKITSPKIYLSVEMPWIKEGIATCRTIISINASCVHVEMPWIKEGIATMDARGTLSTRFSNSWNALNKGRDCDNYDKNKITYEDRKECWNALNKGRDCDIISPNMYRSLLLISWNALNKGRDCDLLPPTPHCHKWNSWNALNKGRDCDYIFILY